MEINGRGYVFTGPSGIGKSYHASLWKKQFGDKATIINGDKIFLKFEAEALTGYSSPWMGKEHIGINKSAILDAICIIKRGNLNEIKQIDNHQDAMSWLLEQSMLKNRKNHILSLVKWFKSIMEAVKLFEITCNQDIEAALVAYNGLTAE